MIGDVRRLTAARPFVPFTICTADGGELRVPAADHIAVSPTGARVTVFAEDDSTILVSTLLIARLAVDSRPLQIEAAG